VGATDRTSFSFPVHYNYRIDTDNKDLNPVAQPQPIPSSMFGVLRRRRYLRVEPQIRMQVVPAAWENCRNEEHQQKLPPGHTPSDAIGNVGIAKPS